MSDQAPARTPSRLPRYVTLLLVLALIAAALYALFFTPFGHLHEGDPYDAYLPPRGGSEATL